MNQEAIKDLILSTADDLLIIGHRNSEWTGIGPMLEEDLAFSSMSQDKIGQAQALYQILHDSFGAKTPDILAFQRYEKEFKSCQFVELPIGDYDFSLVRHFLFDYAQQIRFELFAKSSFQPLAQLAKKIKGEIKYHTLHADTFLKQLGNGTEESHARMQSALNYAWPFALGMFEKSDYESELISEGVFEGEDALKALWVAKITPIITAANLTVPTIDESNIVYGGRQFYHSQYLQPLLVEMTEVTQLDPSAEW